jgi:hypothetical protein
MFAIRYKYTIKAKWSPAIETRTYLKNNLSAHGSVVKRFKMYCSSRFQRDSAFSPFHALP